MEMRNTKDQIETYYRKPEKVLAHIKRNYRRAELLLLRYLDDLPQIDVRVSSRGISPHQCNDWLFELAHVVKQRCGLCVHKDDCEHQCLGKLMEVLPVFCDTCTITDKARCRNARLRVIDGVRTGQQPHREPYSGLQVYDCRIAFAKAKSPLREGSILVLPVPLSSRPDESVTSSLLKAEEYMHLWIKRYTSEDMRGPEASRIIFTIIAMTHMFINDLNNDTTYMNMGYLKSEEDDIEDHESSNVVLAYRAKQDGMDANDIEEMLDNNENPDELLLGVDATKLRSSWVLDPEVTGILIRSIWDIYTNPLLPEIRVENIDRKIKNKLDRLCRNHFLRKSNVTTTELGAKMGTRIDGKYLHYRIFLMLAALIGAARGTRFTHKIPKVFQKDNLIRLKKALDGGSNLKDACDLIGDNSANVIQVIDSNKYAHPRFAKLEPMIGKDKTQSLLTLSTDIDLQVWCSRVNQLKV